ncbi:hypothetical protein ACVR1I_01655 [Streptococcus cameli]
MIPNNTFSYHKIPRFVPDSHSLIQCYQPIIGLPAFALYHYLVANEDGGAGRYRFSQILNHLNFGQTVLEQALDVLSALQLLEIFENESHYTLVLKAPLSQEDFLQERLYRSLLSKKIGEHAVEQMQASHPVKGDSVSKRFSQVFQMDGQPDEKKKANTSFDSSAFQHMMARHQLRFTDEESDLIGLYHLAESEQMDWLSLYQLAKETAVGHQISPKRMKERLQVSSGATSPAEFSKAEQALIRESKSLTPLDFLTAIKTNKRASVMASERACLNELAHLGLLNEVINVIVLYTFNKVDSANLNEKYAMKLGNDFSYHQIRTAEAAILHLKIERKPQAGQKKAETSHKESNIPSWSNPDYKDTTTAEDLVELEKIQREILANLEKGD